jgi:hypothetical protein
MGGRRSNAYFVKCSSMASQASSASARSKSAGSWPEPFGASTSASPCEAPASIVPEGKPPAPDRTCKAAEAITTRAAGLRSRALGAPPGWSAQAARLPGAQSRNSNWAWYRKEISDNIKNSRLAVVLGFGPAPRWARPIHFQKPAHTLSSPRLERAPAGSVDSANGMLIFAVRFEGSGVGKGISQEPQPPATCSTRGSAAASVHASSLIRCCGNVWKCG